MTEKQMAALLKLEEMVKGLIYTDKYKVSEFTTKTIENGIIEVFFEIEREDYFNNIIYQEGTVFIKTNGSMYYLNFMGNPRPVKTIQSVVPPFHD